MHPLEILLKLGLFAMQSVLIGSEYPVMDTLLFYVKNGEKPELSIIIRSRTHSSLCLVLGRDKNYYLLNRSPTKYSLIFAPDPRCLFSCFCLRSAINLLSDEWIAI